MTEKTTIPFLPNNQFKQILFGENDWEESEKKFLEIFEAKIAQNKNLQESYEDKKLKFDLIIIFFLKTDDFKKIFNKDPNGVQLLDELSKILEESLIDFSGDKNVIEKLKSIQVSKTYDFLVEMITNIATIYTRFFQ